MLPNDHRVSLGVAHRFLGTLGITRPTRAYERWVKPDGFDLVDFWHVLAESPFVFIIDWRAVLPDELGLIAGALGELGVRVGVEVADDADAGFVECEGRRAAVRYVASAGDDFADVIRAVGSVVGEAVEFRASPLNGGDDGWVFAVLAADEWAELEGVDGAALGSLFVAMGGGV